MDINNLVFWLKAFITIWMFVIIVYKDVSLKKIWGLYLLVLANTSITFIQTGIVKFNLIEINMLFLRNIIIGIVVIAIFYVLEKMMLVALENDNTIVIDYRFYFKGRLEKVSFLFSVPVLVLEEMVFRWPLESSELTNITTAILIVISSVSFGMIHVVFSKYDRQSKIILGLILSISMLIFKNVLIVILMHLFYNYLALKRHSGGGKK